MCFLLVSSISLYIHGVINYGCSFKEKGSLPFDSQPQLPLSMDIKMFHWEISIRSVINVLPMDHLSHWSTNFIKSWTDHGRLSTENHLDLSIILEFVSSMKSSNLWVNSSLWLWNPFFE